MDSYQLPMSRTLRGFELSRVSQARAGAAVWFPPWIPPSGRSDGSPPRVRPHFCCPHLVCRFYPSCWEEDGCCGARRRSHSTSFSSSEKRSNPLCELFLEHVPFFKAGVELLLVCGPTEPLISGISIMSRGGGGSVPNSASSSLCSLPAPSDLHSSLAAPLTATSIALCGAPSQQAGGSTKRV